jgi:hypothetical protein
MNYLLGSSFLLVQNLGLGVAIIGIVSVPWIVKKVLRGKERSALGVALCVVAVACVLRVVATSEKRWHDVYVGISCLAIIAWGFLAMAVIAGTSRGILTRVSSHLSSEEWTYLCKIVMVFTFSLLGVKLSFLFLIDHFQYTNIFLYFLSTPAGIASVTVITFWTGIIVYMAWTCECEGWISGVWRREEGGRVMEKVKVLIKELVKEGFKDLRTGLFTLYKLLYTYLIWRLYKSIILYEYCIYHNKSLENSPNQIQIMKEYYCIFIITIIIGYFCRSQFANILVFCSGYLNTAMFENHLSRLTYGLFVLPAMVYLYKDRMRRRKEVGYDGWSDILVETILVIVQFGLYTANGESYAFGVNQRAMLKQPTDTPGNNILIQIPHTLNMKIDTILFFNLYIHTLPASHPYHHSIIILTFFYSCELLQGYILSLRAFHYFTYLPMLALIGGPPGVRLLFTGLARFVQSLFRCEERPARNSRVEYEQVNTSIDALTE